MKKLIVCLIVVMAGIIFNSCGSLTVTDYGYYDNYYYRYPYSNWNYYYYPRYYYIPVPKQQPRILPPTRKEVPVVTPPTRRESTTTPQQRSNSQQNRRGR